MSWGVPRESRDFRGGGGKGAWLGRWASGADPKSCPISGKIFAFGAKGAHDRSVDDEIVERIAVSTGLTPAEAARVVGDVIAWYREPTETYVRRRHRSLQTHGVRNDAAFARIGAELAERVVAPPELSARQLRRIVYG